MVGNMSCLSGEAWNWEEIFTTLTELNAIGTAEELPLYGRNADVLKKLKVSSKMGPQILIPRMAARDNNTLPQNQAPRFFKESETVPEYPVENKCDHSVPNPDCYVPVRVIAHKICNHKVVVRCCDQNEESALFCDKSVRLTCLSCGWCGEKERVKCRSVILGEFNCRKCERPILRSKPTVSISIHTQLQFSIMSFASIY